MKIDKSFLWRAVLLMTTALALGACGTTGSVSRVERARQTAPQAVAAGEAITIVGLLGVDDVTIECIDREVRGALPGMRVVRPKEFRDAMYPWFEPQQAPTDTESLSKYMLRPVVTRRVEDLGVHYVAVIEKTMRIEDDTYGGFLLSPAFIGGGYHSETTALTASILDLRQLRSVNRIEAEGKGGFGMGLILVVPYAYSVSSLKAACQSIAGRIAAIFKG